MEIVKIKPALREIEENDVEEIIDWMREKFQDDEIKRLAVIIERKNGKKPFHMSLNMRNKDFLYLMFGQMIDTIIPENEDYE